MCLYNVDWKKRRKISSARQIHHHHHYREKNVSFLCMPSSSLNLFLVIYLRCLLSLMAGVCWLMASSSSRFLFLFHLFFSLRKKKKTWGSFCVYTREKKLDRFIPPVLYHRCLFPKYTKNSLPILLCVCVCVWIQWSFRS